MSKIIVVTFVFFSSFVFGQRFANSPYTSYGLGELGGFDHANFSGLGNAHTAICDSLSLNFYNPASYSFIGKGQPIYSSGIGFQRSSFEYLNQSHLSNLFGTQHFAFGVSFAKILGLSFGLKPFSRVGYEVNEYQALGTDTSFYTYSGKGSINDVFTGFSIKVLNFKKHQLSFGANVSYLFGGFEQNRLAHITSTSVVKSGSLEKNEFLSKSFQYQLGMNYSKEFKHGRRFTIGAVFVPAQTLKTEQNSSIYWLNDYTNETSIVDTLSNFTFNSNLALAERLDLGFSYSFRPKVDSSYNSLKIYQLSIYGNYTQSTWLSNSNGFLSTSGMSFGLEFIPHYNYTEVSKNINYLEKVRYRIGFQQATLPLQNNNEHLYSEQFTLGFGFPIFTQRSVSSLNVGFGLGRKGIPGNQEVVNESFGTINFGITIAPGLYDRWFRKYKID